VEETLASIWAEVLGLERVGVHDSFLELGGHSLIATKIVSRVMATFGVEFPVPLLLDSHTVADMALVVTESQSAVQREDLVRIVNEVETLTDDDAQRFVAEVKDRHR
jgi:acyl carrier protein